MTRRRRRAAADASVACLVAALSGVPETTIRVATLPRAERFRFIVFIAEFERWQAPEGWN